MSIFELTNLFQVIFADVYADKKAVRNKIPINPGMLKHVTVINLTFEVNFWTNFFQCETFLKQTDINF